MNRLPFQLPDFTRRQWTSPRAREVWGPRLQAIARAWTEIERRSVVSGIRSAALTSIAPEALPAEAAWAARNGLVLLPLGTLAAAVEYSASSRAPAAGEAWNYRVVYVRPETGERFVEAWRASDDSTIGEALGYPECCRSFFGQFWKAEGRVDTTWAMSGDPEGGVVDVRDVDPMNQILGRWAGYRAVPHLPCSWRCQATRAFGERLVGLGRELGYDAEMDWLVEALSWPYEWSALHGIAEIRSPILRITTRTDATAETLTVRVHSDRYPAEGARGTRHPYRTWREERRALTQIRPAAPAATTRAQRNGFATERAMRDAHGVLIRAAASKVGEVSSILDLGAGDGTLLRTLGEALGAERLVGVEIAADRARAAVPGVDVRHGDIGAVRLWDEDFDLVVMMPGRLVELADERREMMIEALRQRAGVMLLYGYGDWIARYGGLAELVAATLPGVLRLGPVIEAPGASAALYEIAETASAVGVAA